MIELQYSLDRDDVINFNLWHQNRSGTMRRAKKISVLVIVVPLAALAALTSNAAYRQSGSAYYAATVAAPFVLMIALVTIVLPRFRLWYLKRYIRRAWSEGRNRGVIG